MAAVPKWNSKMEWGGYLGAAGWWNLVESAARRAFAACCGVNLALEKKLAAGPKWNSEMEWGGYLGAAGGWNLVESAARRAFAACCGVNLAKNQRGAMLFFGGRTMAGVLARILLSS